MSVAWVGLWDAESLYKGDRISGSYEAGEHPCAVWGLVHQRHLVCQHSDANAEEGQSILLFGTFYTCLPSSWRGHVKDMPANLPSYLCWAQV